MPTDIGSMTLDEMEALAKRLELAARVVREARMELLGGVVAAQPAQQSVTQAAAPPAQLLPHEVAQREMLLQRNREVLPDEIKRAEGIS